MKGIAYWKAQTLAEQSISAHLRQMNEALHQRIGELEDRLMANSLIELKAARRTEFAMPGSEHDDDSDIWATGPFGHDPQKLPPLTPAEEEYARSQGYIE